MNTELTALAGAAILMKRVSTDMNMADTRHRRPLGALIPTRRGTAGTARAVILMNMGISDMSMVSTALAVIPTKKDTAGMALALILMNMGITDMNTVNTVNTALADALMNIRHAAAGVSIRTALQTG